MVAQLIGKVLLAECRLGISDQLIYRRIEHANDPANSSPSAAPPLPEVIRRRNTANFYLKYKLLLFPGREFCFSGSYNN